MIKEFTHKMKNSSLDILIREQSRCQMHFRESPKSQNLLPHPEIEPKVFRRQHPKLVTVPNEPDTTPWHLNTITGS
jgi:hypothetical protein